MSEIRSQATPAKDSGLTDALRDAVGDNYDHGRNPNLTGQLWHEDGIRDSIDWAGAARDLEREGWSNPRTVNSATELDALPVNTCGVDDGDHYWIRHSENWHCSCDGTDVEWSSENLWEEINLGGPGTFTVLFTPGDAG